MYIVLVVLGFLVAKSQSVQTIRCGILPQNANQCIGNPKIFNTDLSLECDKSNTQCELMTCIFRKADWLDQGKVDHAKLLDYFTTFAEDYPEWSVPANYVKRTCLGDNLSTQGIFLNCPAFDVAHCVLSSFLQFAMPSQWEDDDQCRVVKNYIRSCPVTAEFSYSPAILLIGYLLVGLIPALFGLPAYDMKTFFFCIYYYVIKIAFDKVVNVLRICSDIFYTYLNMYLLSKLRSTSSLLFIEIARLLFRKEPPTTST